MFIEVEGGHKADGELDVQGAKNAVLPMIAATVLCNQTIRFERCPKLQDVYSMVSILKDIGAKTRWEEDTLIVDAGDINRVEIVQEEAGKVRASILFLGSILGKYGHCEIGLPGGCSIGARPIDFHLNALSSLGSEIENEEDRIVCRVKGFGREKVRLPYPSVGATENVILYSVLRKGRTVLENAAKEPEIKELCNFLRKMGARIAGDGSNRIFISGVPALHGTDYCVKSDRIAFLTYAAMVAGTGGKALLKVNGDTFLTEQSHLRRTGCIIEKDQKGYVVSGGDHGIQAIPYIKTEPYPGFPTDAQSLFLALLSKANGESVVEESVFENRFLVANQLKKMGADIDITEQQAYIHGVTRLHGEAVCATDLRSGAALMLAGVMADGTTVIDQAKLILRGYESPVENMQGLGLFARYRCE